MPRSQGDAHAGTRPDRETSLATLIPGGVLGRYVVLGKLGRGGMGTVLKAYDESLDRAIAIKLLHSGAAERHAKRLKKEAQGLAKLSHPNVVHVYEVGHADGQWFIAMELVRGRTLKQWRENRPPWQECVQVYLQAGAGLVAAHAAGLVHRDFKPDNCIIDEQGRPRVLDFGLVRETDAPLKDELPAAARATTPGDQDATLTRAGSIVGTLAYMPLEQLSGMPADERSDQFSFCVSLYEAVYGERPFIGESVGDLTAALVKDEVRPAPKNTRVPGRLRRILLRGLSADRGDRWPSMDALLTELRPLVAPRARMGRPALVVVGGLLALVAGLWWQQPAQEARLCAGAEVQLDGVWDPKRRQEVRAAILGTELPYAPDAWEQVESRLDGYTEAWAGKYTEVCEATAVRREQSEAVMDLRMGCLREHKAALHATVKVLVGADDKVVENAVDLATGLPELPRCDEVERLEQQRQRVPPPEDPQLAKDVQALRERLADIDAMLAAGQYARALEQVEPLVERAEAMEYVPVLTEVMYQRGTLRMHNGEGTEAEKDLAQAYALAAEHGHDDVTLRSAKQLIHVVGHMQARHAEGLLWAQTALPLARRSGDAKTLAGIVGRMGNVSISQGKYQKAESYFRQALESTEHALGEDHPEVATSLSNLALALNHLGEYEEAEREHWRALEIRERALGDRHPDVAMSATNLGDVLRNRGEYEEAKRQYRRALQIGERTLGAEHPFMALTTNNLGEVFKRQGEYEQAERQYRRALQIVGDEPGAEHVLNNLGSTLFFQKKYEEAEPYCRQSLQLMQSRFGEDHPNVAISLGSLGHVLFGLGEYEEAQHHYQRALEIRARALGEEHPLTGDPHVWLAKVNVATDDLEAAREHAERAVAIRETNSGAPERLADARYKLARILWATESERPRALELAEQARSVYIEYGAGRARNLTELEQWLAEHPTP